MKKYFIVTVFLALIGAAFLIVWLNQEEPIVVEEPPQIKVFNPKVGELVGSPIEIAGEARGSWFFEGDFPIKLLNSNGSEITQTYATAQGDWMTEEYVPFTASIDFSTGVQQTVTIVFVKDNPSGLPEFDDEYRLPVELAPTEEMALQIFFGNIVEDPNVLDCTRVYPTERMIIKTEGVARAAIEQLLAGVTIEEQADGFTTAINDEVSLQSIYIDSATAYVDFDEQLQHEVGGSCQTTMIVAQITETLKQFSTVDNVVISINGETEDILQP